MDLSKLPKLSQTPKPPENAPAEPSQDAPGVEKTPTVDYGQAPPPAGAADAWISLAIGAIVLLAFSRMPRFILHKLFGTYFAPYKDVNTGQEVAYTATADFWSDLGITLFGVALVVEGLLLCFARRPAGIAIMIGVTAMATVYNLAYLVQNLQPLPVMSALAVAIGVYMIFYQWGLFQQAMRRAVR